MRYSGLRSFFIIVCGDAKCSRYLPKTNICCFSILFIFRFLAIHTRLFWYSQSLAFIQENPIFFYLNLFGFLRISTICVFFFFFILVDYYVCIFWIIIINNKHYWNECFAFAFLFEFCAGEISENIDYLCVYMPRLRLHRMNLYMSVPNDVRKQFCLTDDYPNDEMILVILGASANKM